jgi:peptidyl-prolyl cis-trans isomerase A (cyclophilin A)
MHAPDAKGADGGLIQGGITSDARKLFPPIAHEPTSETGLHHVAGAISLAGAGPGTGRADFFILISDMPGLDAGGPRGDANGFAAFGHVTEGMDVVKKIWASPTSPTKGEGAMKGQMLDPPIRILHAARLGARK